MITPISGRALNTAQGLILIEVSDVDQHPTVNGQDVLADGLVVMTAARITFTDGLGNTHTDMRLPVGIFPVKVKIVHQLKGGVVYFAV